MKKMHPLVDQLLQEVDSLLKVYRNPELLHTQLSKIETLCEQMLTEPRLPKEPPEGLLRSMALRIRHDFNLEKLDGDPSSSGTTFAVRQAIISDMRRLYDEIRGYGFYRQE